MTIAVLDQQTGSIAVATNEERFEELKRGASMARVFNLEVDLISAAEKAKLWPIISIKSDVS